MPTIRSLVVTLLLLLPLLAQGAELRRYLYVAQPGIRNYTQYGGHGVIVYDIEKDYAFVRRMSFSGLKDDSTPDNVKGICGNASTGRLYVSTIKHLICIDLLTDDVLWERQYEFGCDRMSMSPDSHRSEFCGQMDKAVTHMSSCCRIDSKYAALSMASGISSSHL